jgi:phenylalanyl-tRNA synthetase beta chain
MKLSLRWLSRHVDLAGLTPERIRDDLTMSTAEIEGLQRLGAGLETLVVGHVAERTRHPGADKLSLTRVDVGSGEPLPIVCGAPNVAAGQKVAVALPGTVLPDGTRIKPAKIRGESSHGMVCSERELGLSDDHGGILVLDAEAPVGARLVDVLPVQDHVLEIDNKSINHRPDLWGHYGFARELAAIYRRELRPLDRAALPAQGDAPVVEIADLQACPRYCALFVDGIAAAPSPAWLRWLLHAVGQRPINLLVDLTNFVMLDIGQPMHAFDRRRVEAGIGVRFAQPGESITTLDGVVRPLTDKDLLITSGGAPVAIAGVMGGLGSAVGDDTTSILLESATFHPSTVRRTSARLGHRTDASARFEKSLDPALAELGVRRFVLHLQAIQPQARAAGPLADPARWRHEPRKIALRKARLTQKLGVDLPDEEVEQILERLKFEVARGADGFTVTVPSFRATKDVTIEDDLIEEVGRMHRYDRIPELPLRAVVAAPPREPELYLGRELGRIAALELGAHEVYDYTFVPDRLLEAAGVLDLPHVRVTNPVAPDVTRVRRTVLPSLLGAAAPNLRTRAEVRAFEHGKGYQPESRDAHGLPREVRELAIAWARRDGPDPLAELRSRVEALLARAGYPADLDAAPAAGLLPYEHPGRTVAAVRGGAVVARLGTLHPRVARALELPTTTAIAVLDLRAMLGTGRAQKALQPIPRFPEQPVDVALLVAAAVPVARARALLRDAGGGLVRDVRLFEVYRGPNLPPGQKSLNFTVILGADDRTLTAADEAQYLAALRARVAEVGAELRG